MTTFRLTRPSCRRKSATGLRIDHDPREKDQSPKEQQRDDLTLLVWGVLNGADGLTIEQVADRAGISREASASVVRHLASGRKPLAVSRDGLWRAVKETKRATCPTDQNGKRPMKLTARGKKL